MTLTENQCKKLRDAILNVYPAQNKAALESFLSEKFHINLEYILAYSKHISDYGKLNQITHKENNQKRNEIIKILILKIPAKDLDLDKELYEIKNAIKQSKNRKLLNYKTEIVYSTDDIRREIADEKPQIVHFCGHGLQDGTLKLDNSNSGVSPEVLKSIFQGREDTIKCVLLNACHSEKATLAITQHINYAIGMNNEIIDNVAIEFAKGFYDGLGYNNDNNAYLMAFNEGIRAIISKNISQKSVPVLRTRISYEEAIINLIKQLDAENKINELVKELKSHHPTNSLLRKFISYYEHPLNEDELNKFQTIINGVDDCAIQSAYGKLFTDDISDKNTIISKLVENDHKKSNIPLIVEFAHDLAAILEKNQNKNENNQSQYLRNWLNELPNEFKISNQNESHQKQVKTDLWIIVEPLDNQLCLEALVMEEGKNIKEDLKALNLTSSEDEKGIRCDSFEEIPFKIDEIIDAYKKNKYELTTTTIELFLPMCHIENNIFYDWLQDKFAETMTSGFIREKRIRIHLNERRKKVNYYHLERRYKEYEDLNQSNSFTPNEKIDTINENVNKKKVEMFVSQLNGKFGVKLCSKHKKNQIQHFFSVILKAGTFLIFWLKYSSPENLSLNQIDHLLFSQDYSNNNDDYFHKIIGEMHNLIRDDNSQLNPKEYLGYHLGFLCDNPYRIPEIKPFKSF